MLAHSGSIGELRAADEKAMKEGKPITETIMETRLRAEAAAEAAEQRAEQAHQQAQLRERQKAEQLAAQQKAQEELAKKERELREQQQEAQASIDPTREPAFLGNDKGAYEKHVAATDEKIKVAREELSALEVKEKERKERIRNAPEKIKAHYNKTTKKAAGGITKDTAGKTTAVLDSMKSLGEAKDAETQFFKDMRSSHNTEIKKKKKEIKNLEQYKTLLEKGKTKKNPDKAVNQQSSPVS